MHRILCLDVGDKKIGVAVSDPLGMTAQGLVTLKRMGFAADSQTLFEYCSKYDIETLVVGLPLDGESKEGRQAQKVRYFAQSIETFLKNKGLNISLVFWDESGSSQDAEAILLEADLSRKKRKKVIDKIAAVLILRSYLESHS